MKNILFIIITLLFNITANAKVWTCSNDPLKPAQFSDLQAAIDAAPQGDTIYVYPSGIHYEEDIYLYKQLTLIGGGMLSNGSWLRTLYICNYSTGQNASNSVIEGFHIEYANVSADFEGGDEDTQVLDNITISKCWILYLNFKYARVNPHQPQTFSNISITNCLLNKFQPVFSVYSYWFAVYTNVSFNNNIIEGFNLNYNNNGYATLVYQNTPIVFRNNLFLNGATYSGSVLDGMLFENNIFYKAEPLIGNGGTIYNNNITYAVGNVLPGANNYGSGNKNNILPQFVNYPTAGGAFDWSFDYHLKATSPGKNAGTDATDIGIYGGAFPWDVNVYAKVPKMLELTISDGNNSVPKEGAVKIRFKANTGQ